MLIANQYTITSQIAEGSRCSVHEGKHIDTNHKVAIKINKAFHRGRILTSEANVLKQIRSKGVLKVKWVGMQGLDEIMVTDLLGQSLQEVVQRRIRLSLPEVLEIGVVLLNILEDIHSAGYVHRNLQPSKLILSRRPKQNLIYLTGFIFARKFMDPATKHHSANRQGIAFNGNYIYASINSLMQLSNSRRDDIEGLVYCLIFLIKGKLPWQHLENFSKDAILQFRNDIDIVKICSRSFPIIGDIFQYARSLGYTDAPDYNYLRNRLIEFCRRAGSSIELPLDWSNFKLFQHDRDCLAVRNVRRTETKRVSFIDSNSRRPTVKVRKQGEPYMPILQNHTIDIPLNSSDNQIELMANETKDEIQQVPNVRRKTIVCNGPIMTDEVREKISQLKRNKWQLEDPFVIQ